MSACNVPPTHKLPPIPTPPATVSEPLLVVEVGLVPGIYTYSLDLPNVIWLLSVIFVP